MARGHTAISSTRWTEMGLWIATVLTSSSSNGDASESGLPIALVRNVAPIPISAALFRERAIRRLANSLPFDVLLFSLNSESLICEIRRSGNGAGPLRQPLCDRDPRDGR